MVGGGTKGTRAAASSRVIARWGASPERARTAMWAEFIATFGLLAIVLSCVASASRAAPYAIAAYITGAYWFTSSTSFANPAVTIARSLTNTFSGIARDDVPGFVAAQIAAVPLALVLMGWILKTRKA